MRDLWYGTSGSTDAPIVVVGESWGLEEFQQKRPFVGSSGTELHRILAEAKLDHSQILFTNMVADRPPANETWRFFKPKATKPQRIGGLAPTTETCDEISRLYRQISANPRRLVIAVGNWSMWALSNRAGSTVIRESNGRAIPVDQQTWTPTGITSWRGSMWYCEPHPEFGDLTPHIPFLPIVHPAAILRQWTLRAPTVHDLRARVPMALRQDWRQPHAPVMHAPPTFGEACGRLEHWLVRAKHGEKIDLAVDIETVRRLFISCIGFCDSPYFAMSIPFLHHDREDGSLETYWTTDQEATLIGLIRQVLSHPNIKVIGQNFIYDTQYIQHWFGVTPQLHFDTMLAQNVLFPGTPKTLEYLSSLYCSYHWYWKDHKDWDTVETSNSSDYNCTDVLALVRLLYHRASYRKTRSRRTDAVQDADERSVPPYDE
jgi:uracil-DNA glycosylase family 4